jgi:2-oxoglutarate ferredoxin oxidoreductase subunit delta
VTGDGVRVSRGTLVIDVEACKGCELCISACPPGVLSMTTHEVNTRGYRYPELVAGCTGCKACSQVCPDFVFQVYKYDIPLASAAAGEPGSVRSGDPGRTDVEGS